MRSEADPSVSEIRILSSGLAVKKGPRSSILDPQIPGETGNLTGNFRGFAANSARSAPIPVVISMCCRQIPCYPRKGAFFSNFNALWANSLRWPEQGIFSPEQGIYPAEQGISFP